MNDTDPHPPTRHCNCPKCLASFDDTALDPEHVQAVVACLGDDAGMLRDAHPEAANNMDAAATLIERLYELANVGPAPSAAVVLGRLGALSDDAAVHIYPSDLEKCSRSECVVEVVSVRATNMGNGEHTVPLFSLEQVAAALTVPVVDGSAAYPFELLQRQPPKGWGVYRVPDSTDILISKPNGDGIRVFPAADKLDQLLYELASAMLPPPAPEIQL